MKEATVTYDPGVTDPQKLITALQADHGGRYSARVKR